MAGEVSDEVLADLLIQDVENPIEINVEDATEISWGKSLRHMPLFTIKEIEMHRQEILKSQ